MFGGFNISAGLTSLKDFNDKLTKMKEDMERNIETSLGLDGQAENAASAAAGSGRLCLESKDSTASIASVFYMLALTSLAKHHLELLRFVKLCATFCAAKPQSEVTDGWDGENIVLSDIHVPSMVSLRFPWMLAPCKALVQ